jgi:hypothetical protein
MRILFDQGTPVPLRTFLVGHNVATTYEMNWAELENGELLKAAQIEFDALVTTDQSLRYQQNLSSISLAVLVLPTTSWPKLKLHTDVIAASVNALRPGDFVEFALP